MSDRTSGAADRSPLFTFVVVADTHVNEGEHTSTSPYETNHLANPRARHVFAEIAAMRPAPRFVVHLGDIVHPVPSLPAFHDAVAHFKTIASQLPMPLHLIPGNHDVGDKTVDWMPAEQVCDAFLATYRKAFGADFHAFDEAGVRFVMLNSLLLNSGLADEARQRAWLERRIDTAGHRRVFLFMHYPPYIYRPDEPGNYDNVDEPARTWLLEQIAKPAVEAVFAGHVHNFWYDRAGAAEMYLLPSTSFLRHDFSEFCSVPPAADTEFGRDDRAKFGYFRVDVMAHGHVAYAVRSHGRQCAPGEIPDVSPRRHLAHPKTSGFDNVGVELRHPWAEVMQITATGGVQEFGRKRARNDYPLLALWEMGVRLSKVPEVDVLESESRERMRLMARLGHRYVVTAIGVPRDAVIEAAGTDAGVVACEANLTLERFESRRGALRAVRERSGVGIFLAKILTDREARISGTTFSHFVKSGFTVGELAHHRSLVADAIDRGEIDGVTVRLDVGEPLPAAAHRLREFNADTGARILVSLKLSGSGVATARTDDRETAARAAQAMVLSRCGSDILYVFDTFMDVDRGYYPRNAFIDRRFNPRPAAGVFTALASLFPGRDTFTLTDSGSDEATQFEHAGARFRLVCARRDGALAALATLAPDDVVHDLLTGREAAAPEMCAAVAGGMRGDDSALHVLMARLR